MQIVPSVPYTSIRGSSKSQTSKLAMTVARAPDANRSAPVTWVSTSTANVSPRRGPFSIVRRG